MSSGRSPKQPESEPPRNEEERLVAMLVPSGTRAANAHPSCRPSIATSRIPLASTTCGSIGQLSKTVTDIL